MKRPSFQFYVGDWMSDLKLRRCTPAARGVWVDVLCALHDSDDAYGLLRWPLKEIARTVGASMAHVRELVDKGVLRGSDAEITEPLIYVPRSGRKDGAPVTLIAAQPGPLWYSKRMVRDEYVRASAGASTRFGSAPPDESPARTAAAGTQRAKLRERVLAKTDGHCHHCNRRLGDIWEIDHLVPRSKGGRHTFENMVPSCVGCNQDKSDTMPDDWDALSRSPSASPSHRQGDGSSPPSSSPTSSSNVGDGTSPPVTQYGAIAKALRLAGIEASPGTLRFRTLVDAGATAEEFLALVPDAKGKDRPFAYLLGAVEGERKRAAATAPQLHRGPMPQQPAGRKTAVDRQVETMNALTGRSPDATRASPPAEHIVDVAARVVG